MLCIIHAPIIMSYLYKKSGNCLFRAVSYCIFKTEDRHSGIRSSNVDKIIIDWEYYKDFIVHLPMVNSANDLSSVVCRQLWCRVFRRILEQFTYFNTCNVKNCECKISLTCRKEQTVKRARYQSNPPFNTHYKYVKNSNSYMIFNVIILVFFFLPVNATTLFILPCFY